MKEASLLSFLRVRSGLLLLLLGGLSARDVQAQSAEERAAAETLFQTARKLLSEGKVAEACEKFEASNRLDPAPGTMLNLADCFERAGRTASAWISFREAASAASKAGDERRAKEAADRASALEGKLSKLTLDVSPELAALPGFRVERDGKPIERALWKISVPVDPGRHSFLASAQGYQPWRKDLEIPPGTALVLPLPMLVAEAPPGPPVASSAPPPSSSPPSPPPSAPAQLAPAPEESGGSAYRIGAATAAGLGAVGVLLGAYYGVRASSRWEAAQSHCRQGLDQCDPDAASLSRDALRAGNTSTIAFSAGGLLLATGAVLWWLAPPAHAPRSGRVSPGLDLGPGRASLSLGGAF